MKRLFSARRVRGWAPFTVAVLCAGSVLTLAADTDPRPQLDPVTTVSTPSAPRAMPPEDGIADILVVGPSCPHFTDLDDDGDPDLLVGTGDGQVDVYTSTPDGYVLDDTRGLDLNIDFGVCPAAADADGDDDPDLLLGTEDSQLRYFENTAIAFVEQTGDGNPFNSINASFGWLVPAFADADGDDDPDLFLADEEGPGLPSPIRYFENDGVASPSFFDGAGPVERFGDANPASFLNNLVGGRYVPAFADADGDDDPDLFLGTPEGTIRYFINTGTPTEPVYEERTGPENPYDGIDVGSNSAITLADVDGDGDLDAVIGSDDGTLIYVPGTAPVVLPVELVGFTALVDAGGVALRWETASETNNVGFEIEQRRQGEAAWQRVGFVEGQGTTTRSHAYQTRLDDVAPGTYAFRLRQLDTDGAVHVSSMVEVVVGLPGAYRLSEAYPNPFRTQATLTLAVEHDQVVRVVVHDLLGREVAVLHEGALTAGTVHAFTFSADGLPAGRYVVTARGKRFTAHRTLTLVK